MSKTSVFAKLTATPGTRDAVLAALRDALPSAQAEAGTEVYTFHLDKADADVVWIFELYTDDDALAVHSGSEALATLFGAIGDKLAEPPMLVLADYVDGKGPAL